MHRSLVHRLLVLATIALALPALSAAQPFGGYMVLDGDVSDYIEIPHDSELNPATAITLEGWVRWESLDCTGLIGKNWLVSYWIGSCIGPLRSYLRGGASNKDGGAWPIGEWTHWAVTSNGTTRRHYLNGELVGEFAEAGPPTASTSPLRIGSDVSFEEPIFASLDEFRLWNVARTQAQIQNTMNQAISSPLTGLVAVWSLDSDGSDALGVHHGTVVGSPEFVGDVPTPGGPWLTTPEQPGFRFKVRISPDVGTIAGEKVDDCIIETLCVSGQLPGRPEVFIKIIGPRPNGFLWVQISRFTPSRVEIWVHKLDTDEINYYNLPSVPATADDVPGRQDREAFLP